jgi:hypothetical protein
MAFILMDNWGGSTDPTASVTDTQGNTWTQIGTYLNDSAGKKATSVWITYNSKPGPNTVNWSIPNSVFVNGTRLYIAEYTGVVSNVSPIGSFGNQAINGTSDPSVALSISSIGELVVLFWVDNGLGSPTYPTGFTVRQNAGSPTSSILDGAVTATGSQSYQVTMGGSSGDKFLWAFALTTAAPLLPGTCYAFIA